MSRTHAIAILAVTILVAFPAAGATWMSYGTYEPDTTLDTPTFMWADQPGAIKDRVYFNTYHMSGPGVAGTNGEVVNPNVGALRTNIDPQGDAFFEAVLGVWTDCNQDGYIGMLETAVREYDARLLLDDEICPPVAMPPGVGNIQLWVPGANNYRSWVTELIPIAMMPSGDARTYVDTSAMVWGEPTKPDDGAALLGAQCQGRARGDSKTVGGIIWQLDCQGKGIGIGVTAPAGVTFSTGEIARVPIVATFNEVDATAGTGLGFGNDPANSQSPLNLNTFGDDESSHSAVYLQDCDAEPILVTGDVAVGDDLDNRVILRPTPATIVNGDVNSWTVPGTMNATFEEFGLVPDDTTNTEVRRTANCDYTDDSGQDFYRNLEGNVDVPPYNGKDAAWSNFQFHSSQRGSLPGSFYPVGSGITSGAGKGGVPTDLGVEARGIQCSASDCTQTGWFGAFITYSSRLLETRFTMDDPAGTSADLPRAQWWSFYAHVGSVITTPFDTPGGANGVYGGVQCAGSGGSGQQNGWNCDPAAWYRRSDGSYPPLPPSGQVKRAVPGDTYQLRDVDCYDGSLDQGVGTAPAYYGPSPCERP